MNIKVILTLSALAFAGLIAKPGMALANQNPVVINADRPGLYVGTQVGRSFQATSDLSAGVQVGYQVHRNVRVEANYDHFWNGAGSRNFNAVTFNAIGQQRIPGTSLTPYVLGGVGVEFNEFRSAMNDGSYRGIYNVGAGMRVAISNNLEVDARYRYIAPITSRGDTVRGSMTTLGLVYRF